MRRLPILTVAIAAAAITTAYARKTPDLAWPQFRGPAGAGILDQAKLPATWSNTSNVAWRCTRSTPRPGV